MNGKFSTLSIQLPFALRALSKAEHGFSAESILLHDPKVAQPDRHTEAGARRYWRSRRTQVSPTSQEWEALVKKAVEEGEVAIYAIDSIGNAQSICAAFQKRYPKITLRGTSVGLGSDLFPQLFSERRAGRGLAGVFLAGPTAPRCKDYRSANSIPTPSPSGLASAQYRGPWF